MRVHLGRRYHFCASHRLHVASLSDEANRGLYGKCNNPHGHGHNYVVEVIFSRQIEPTEGMVLNLATLDAFAEAEVVECLDCTNLNALAMFREQVPSTENLAIALHGIFARFQAEHAPAARLEQVHVQETGNNGFLYLGEAGKGTGALLG